jgi:hypothetical protein
MKQVKIEGLTELEKRIERLAKWSEKDSVKLRQIDERVANVYNTALRANIKDADKDIYVYRKNRGRGRNPGSITGERKGVRQIIKSGALRRSIKVFRRSNKAITLAGPKTRGRRGGTTKTNRQDGWFASIVENGSGFGPGRNKGVFTRTQRATNQRMRLLRLKLLQQEFKRYMK